MELFISVLHQNKGGKSDVFPNINRIWWCTYIVHSIDYNLFFFNNNYPLNTPHKIIENGVGFFFFSPLVSTEKEKKVQTVGPDVG